MSTYICVKSSNGEKQEVKIGDDGHIYNSQGRDLGIKVSPNGNIVNHYGRILQEGKNVKDYLEKTGFFDWDFFKEVFITSFSIFKKYWQKLFLFYNIKTL